MSKHLLLGLFVFFMTAALSYQQVYSQIKQTTIEEIISNPENFEGVYIEISGLVIQYVHDKGSTNYYLLKGDYGGIIRVNTYELAPETNSKYIVKGIVYIDRNSNTVFISEKEREYIEFPTPVLRIEPPSIKENEDATISWTSINAKAVTLNGELVDLTGSRKITGKNSTKFVLQAEYPNGKYKEAFANLTVMPPDNNYLYALVAMLVIVVGAFLYFQFRRRDNGVVPAFSGDFNSPVSPAHQDTVHMPKEDKNIYTGDSDYKTIRVVKNTPKTMKFIPGKFVISDGKDRGKEFKIAAFPTNKGFIVTLGRKEVAGERAYSHIQLNEMTVSREQAELHLIENRLYIKNLSETNPTELNGNPLDPGQMDEVKPGSIVKAGEVEFQYIV